MPTQYVRRCTCHCVPTGDAGKGGTAQQPFAMLTLYRNVVTLSFTSLRAPRQRKALEKHPFLHIQAQCSMHPGVPTPLGHPGSCSACIKFREVQVIDALLRIEERNLLYLRQASAEVSDRRRQLCEACTCGCPRMSIIPPSLAKQQQQLANTGWPSPSSLPLSPGPPVHHHRRRLVRAVRARDSPERYESARAKLAPCR